MTIQYTHILNFNGCIIILQAFLVNLLLVYLESDDNNLGYGLTLVAAVFACEITRACVDSGYLVYSSQTGK